MKETCEWVPGYNDGNWDTQCGEIFVFNDCGPAENGFKFCPYCGKKLIEAIEED